MVGPKLKVIELAWWSAWWLCLRKSSDWNKMKCSGFNFLTAIETESNSKLFSHVRVRACVHRSKAEFIFKNEYFNSWSHVFEHQNFKRWVTPRCPLSCRDIVHNSIYYASRILDWECWLSASFNLKAKQASHHQWRGCRCVERRRSSFSELIVYEIQCSKYTCLISRFNFI